MLYPVDRDLPNSRHQAMKSLLAIKKSPAVTQEGFNLWRWIVSGFIDFRATGPEESSNGSKE